MFLYLKVRIIEAVYDVPAELQELPPLQYDAVKEAETEEQLSIQQRPRAAQELSLRHPLIETLHIPLHPLQRHKNTHKEHFNYGTQHFKHPATVCEVGIYSMCTLGGSVVILMPVCRMAMGNSGWGEELNHSRKSGWHSWTCSSSTNLSSSHIQERDRWQLARNTQWPTRGKLGDLVNQSRTRKKMLVVGVAKTHQNNFNFQMNSKCIKIKITICLQLI